MGQNRDQRETRRDRNEAETGEPIQLNEKDKKPGHQQGGHQGGQEHQGGGQGGQQQPRPSQPGQGRPDDKQHKPA